MPTKTRMLRLRVTDEEHARAEALAARTGRTVSDLLRLMLTMAGELVARLAPPTPAKPTPMPPRPGAGATTVAMRAALRGLK